MEYDDTPPRNARGFRKGNFTAGLRRIRRAAANDMRP